MKGREDEQQAIRRAALHWTGIDPDLPRMFEGQVSTLGMGGALSRLPVAMVPQVDLFDPTTLDRHFMVDASEIDGDHLIQ